MKQLWFKKWLSPGSPGSAPLEHQHGPLYVIEFEMMLKGHTYERPTGKVRQCAVTVDGATRLVTSGDKVDRATYDALLRFDAIKPAQTAEKHSADMAD